MHVQMQSVHRLHLGDQWQDCHCVVNARFKQKCLQLASERIVVREVLKLGRQLIPSFVPGV